MAAALVDVPEVETDGRPALRSATGRFVEARVRTRPPRPRPQRRWRLRFLTRPIGRDTTVRHDIDPTVQRPAPAGRVMVNALASLAAVLVLGLAVVGMAPSVLGYRSVVVTSGAMSPSLGPGDVVILRPTDGVGLPVGSVIEADRRGDGVLQRIVSVVDGRYRVAFDATPAVDRGTVDDAEVRGVGVMVVPIVGLPFVWLEQGRWVPLVTLAVALAAIAYTARLRWIEATPGRRRA